MTQTEAWTIGRLLTWTADYLKENAAESPRLDAEVLLAHVLGCERIELYTRYGEEADEDVRSRFRELVRRRAGGEPVAYLVENREFYSMPFYVNQAVLIPRPETEFVVIELLDWAKQQNATDDPLQIADVGTGSGILAVCSAVNLPQAQVTAIDVSVDALRVAARNIEQHDVSDRISLKESNLLSALPARPTFDAIVSNPPYVSEDEYQGLADEVRNHEPGLALVGGPTGTELIQQLVPQAAERLHPGGLLLMEISPMIAPLVKEIVDADQRLQPAEIIKDLAGYPRIVKTTRRANMG